MPYRNRKEMSTGGFFWEGWGEGRDLSSHHIWLGWGKEWRSGSSAQGKPLLNQHRGDIVEIKGS
jgi:hypothetical protein